MIIFVVDINNVFINAALFCTLCVFQLRKKFTWFTTGVDQSISIHVAAIPIGAKINKFVRATQPKLQKICNFRSFSYRKGKRAFLKCRFTQRICFNGWAWSAYSSAAAAYGPRSQSAGLYSGTTERRFAI